MFDLLVFEIENLDLPLFAPPRFESLDFEPAFFEADGILDFDFDLEDFFFLDLTGALQFLTCL